MQTEQSEQKRNFFQKNAAIITAVMLVVSVALFIASTVLLLLSLYRKPTFSDAPNKLSAVYETYKYNAVELKNESAGLTATAFVYTRNGDELFLVTNLHVSGTDPSTLRARFYGKTSFYLAGNVTLAAYNAVYDIAVLKTKLFPDNPYVDMRKENAVEYAANYAEEIICLGNNLGFGIQVQNGIISSQCIVVNPHDPGRITDAVATIGVCAPLNSGDSGAPVIGANGKLVGMQTWRVDYNGANKPVDSTCWITPAPIIAAAVENVISRGMTGEADFPIFGMTSGEYGTLRIHDIRTTLKFDDFRLKVNSVEALGTSVLKEGDIIKKFGLVEVRGCNFVPVIGELFMYNAAGKGKPLTLTIERGGVETTVTIEELKGVRV